jgi:hypothetical protein
MDESVTQPVPVVPTTESVGSPPVVAPPTRRERMRGPLVTAGIVGGLTVALHFRDPHASGSWGFCPWAALTGFYCPGCGGLRAVNDLTNGDIVGAASSNLVFVLMVPVLVLLWLRWARRAWTGGQPTERGVQHPGAWIAVFAAVMVVFGVLRNLPAGSWLAP